MSTERKTRGRQRIPMRLIEKKDDLLVSFSKRRVGVYKKVSELSTLCGVDAGAIIFSPSGIPHSFFTPDFDTVVHGRRSAGDPRTRIRGLNKRLDEAIEQQEREEKREKQLAPTAAAADMAWWEVPLQSLDGDQVKEQIDWFQALRAQIKTRLQNDFPPPPPPPFHAADRYVFDPCTYPPPSFNVSQQYVYPPSPHPRGLTHCYLPQGYGGDPGPSRPDQN